MKIIHIHQVPKQEDPFAESFLEHYPSEVRLEGIPEDSTQKTPDYFVHGMGLLIEVKQIVDRAQTTTTATWGKVVESLRARIDVHEKLPLVQGLFSISTPWNLKFSRDPNKIEDSANKIVEAVLANEKTITLLGIQFTIKKTTDKSSGIYFTSSEGGSINPPGTIHQNIKDSIATANQQLAYTGYGKPNKRILLLVNKYIFASRFGEVIQSLCFEYENLLKYKNIDEIWVHYPDGRDGPHVLLYTKDFLTQFDQGNLKYSSENAHLFQHWFFAFEARGDETKEKILVGLRSLLAHGRPYEVFDDDGKRGGLARLGIWLAEKERWADVIWLVNQFIDDTSPPPPQEYPADYKFNYHEEIRNGETMHAITTVLGHLAWVIQKLATQEKYIFDALQFTEKLLCHPNYYVRLQGLVPLVEIVARRKYLEDADKRDGTQNYKKVRDLVFETMRECGKYPAIAKHLSQVLYYMKDLDTDEAIEALNILQASRESAFLFVYFGVFRKWHFPKVPFDGGKLEAILLGKIRQTDEQSRSLRSSIAWWCWKILHNEPDQFDKLIPVVDVLAEQPYVRGVDDDLARIIEEWSSRKLPKSYEWFMALIQRAKEHVGQKSTDASSTWFGSENTLAAIAEQMPNKLVATIESLIEIWNMGCYVGHPKDIFASYRKISSPAERERIKGKLMVIYEKIRKDVPTIEQVDWT